MSPSSWPSSFATTTGRSSTRPRATSRSIPEYPPRRSTSRSCSEEGAAAWGRASGPGARMGRAIKPQVIAERGAGVLGAEQAAPLEERHDVVHELVQASGKVVKEQVESVRPALAEPGF